MTAIGAARPAGSGACLTIRSQRLTLRPTSVEAVGFIVLLGVVCVFKPEVVPSQEIFPDAGFMSSNPSRQVL
jgi:hypothetical protein